jgi:hypothetical protein
MLDNIGLHLSALAMIAHCHHWRELESWRATGTSFAHAAAL